MKTTNRDAFLDRLFALYASLVEEFEPSPEFVAKVWAAIGDSRDQATNWFSYWKAWGPRLAAVSAALAALLFASQWIRPDDRTESWVLESTYVDELAQESLNEQGDALWLIAENGQ